MTLIALAACSSPAGQATEPPQALPFCDGNPSIRFVYRNIGGGALVPGSGVLSENGANFLITDGRCHFWARTKVTGDTREGDLSETDVTRLATAFKLEQWATLAGDYVDTLCDGPTREYRFVDRTINVHSSCGGQKTSTPVDWLLAVANSELSALYEAGAPVAGPVRYTLVAEPSDSGWPPWWLENAVVWPIVADPKTIAVPYLMATNYVPGSGVLATAHDADTLRSARRGFAEKNGFQLTGGLIPIVDAQSDKFDLFVRDVIPQEDAQGILHLY